MRSSGIRRLLAISVLLATTAALWNPAAAGNSTRGPAGLSAPINGALEQPSSAQAFWLLPMCGRLDKKGTVVGTAGGARHKELTGSVTVADESNRIGRRVDELLDAALERDPQTKVLDKAAAHFRSIPMRMVAQGKDAANFSVPYQGFGPSSEAADIVLGEKLKLKSRASAEYARQKHIDELHVKITASVMQIAMGLGMSDRARGRQVTSSGLTSLKGLVGDGEADKTMTVLVATSREVSVPESIYAQGVWDVDQRREKLKTVVEHALDNDPVVKEIERRLHKYNHRSAFARVSAHVVETALGVAGMAPDFIGAAGKAALVTFVMATGGPEQSKILKELYLDKRFESRWKTLTEEAHLAVDNYHVAVLTRNPVLLACAESLVQEMSGPEAANTAFGQTVVAPSAHSTLSAEEAR